MSRLILLTVVLFLTVSSVFSQDLSLEFERMYKKLEKLTTFEFVVDYAVNDTSEFRNENGKLSVLITPDGYFYKTEFGEILINRANTLIINEEERMIIYSDNQSLKKKEETYSFSTMLKGLDSLITHSDSIYFSFDGVDRIYYIRSNYSYFNLIELRFNGDMLTTVDYYYNPEIIEKEGIRATNKIVLDEHPVFDPKIFQTSFYFTIQNNQVVPTENFTGYGFVYNESADTFLK